MILIELYPHLVTTPCAIGNGIAEHRAQISSCTDQTESLVAVAKRYDLTVPEMMKWNGITEMKDVYPGMKLIVQKGNPGEPTEAEAIVIEKENIWQEMASFTERRLKKMDLGLQRNTIVYINIDLDPHSLGNRMYAEDKEENYSLTKLMLIGTIIIWLLVYIQLIKAISMGSTKIFLFCC